MFKSILFLHIIVLVTANPLQGYISYPLIQYKENYNAEHPLFIQPSSTSYVQLFPAQNHLTPYQNIPVSYNDYGQRIYLDRNIENLRKGAGIDSTYNANGYVSYPTDATFIPNILNSFIPAPLERNFKNQTTDCNKRCKKTENNRKLQCFQNSRENKDNKGKKRNNQDSNGKRMIMEEKHDTTTNNDVFRKNKRTNKMHKQQEIEKSEKKLNDSKSKNKLPNKNVNLSETSNTNDFVEKIPSIKTEKSKSKTCNSEHGITEIDDYFDITEDCSNLESRCVRNSYNNNINKFHPQFSYMSNDFSNHINAYMNNLMNSQYTNLNSNFPYNFEHLYNMPQFSNVGTNESQKRQKKKKKANKKKKHKKLNKKNCDKNTKNTEKIDCEKIVELSPKEVAIEKSPIISKINETDTAHDENTPLSFLSPIKASEIFDDVLDTNSKIYVYPEISSPYSLNDDLKEFNVYDIEDYTPFSNMYYGIDDYYPDFRSDLMYMSKEDYDWNSFHARNYYFCDKNELENCDFALLPDTSKSDIAKDDQKLNPSFEKLVLHMPPKSNFENKGFHRLRVEDIPNNDRILEDLNKEIIFITPPGLENPDFRTNMINKDKYTSTPEIYYQPSNNAINNKMSTYSDVKSTVMNGKTNRYIDQNNVETNFGHSKVVKYGSLIPNYEMNDLINDFIDRNEENNSNDDITTLVIAESVPNLKK